MRSGFEPSDNVFVPGGFGKVPWWIAGGSGGIGRAVALALARTGASLILSARDERNLKVTEGELLDAGAAWVGTCVLPMECDDMGARVDEALRRFAGENGEPTLAGVLLNGGGPHGGRVGTLTAADFDTAHTLLLKGPALLLSALFPYLRKPGASVVAITSTTVREPNVDLPLSAAYRTGLVALLKNAAIEWGPLGIRVNNVAPGYTATERLNELKDFVAEKNGSAGADVERAWAALAPLGRIAAPDEIAQAVLFLFSRASSYVTGQTLVVDGGQVRGY